MLSRDLPSYINNQNTVKYLGWYLCLAEILVGKTGVPGVKTTARGEEGIVVHLSQEGIPFTVTLTVLASFLLSLFLCLRMFFILKTERGYLGFD